MEARTFTATPAVLIALLQALTACGSSNSERPFARGAAGAGGAGVAGNSGGVAATDGGGFLGAGSGGVTGLGGSLGNDAGANGGSGGGGGVAPPDATPTLGDASGPDTISNPARLDVLPPLVDGNPADTAAPLTPVAASCPVVPAPSCDAMPPPAPARRSWKNFASILVAAGNPQHRGRDLFFTQGDPQWLIGRFSYAPFDAALAGEEVEVFLLRNCTGAWESLGVGITTAAGDQPTTEGAEDNGGRLYVRIPMAKTLGPGRHRVHFVVAGDSSRADQFIEVVPAQTAIVVVDVDGTLTTSETAEFGALLTGQISEAHPDAARAITLLSEKGYRPFYLTARPEWLVQRTRDFLKTGGFPAGIVETTTSSTGAQGASARIYKTDALARLRGKRLVPWFGIGNTDSDAAAYASAIAAPASRNFLAYTDDQNGGKRFETYADLIKDLARLPSLCRTFADR